MYPRSSIASTKAVCEKHTWPSVVKYFHVKTTIDFSCCTNLPYFHKSSHKLTINMFVTTVPLQKVIKAMHLYKLCCYYVRMYLYSILFG